MPRASDGDWSGFSWQVPRGLQRFPINMRYPRELRDSVEKLTLLPIVTAAGAMTTLGAVADLVT